MPQIKIQHKIDDFLFELFSMKEKNIESLKELLIKYYSYGPFKPIISINNDWITIEIDTPTIITQENDYRNCNAL